MKNSHSIKPMNVKNKIPKVSKTFFDGQFDEMIKDGVKAKGWTDYKESPYAEHKRYMNERTIITQDDRTDPRA